MGKGDACTLPPLAGACDRLARHANDVRVTAATISSARAANTSGTHATTWAGANLRGVLRADETTDKRATALPDVPKLWATTLPAMGYSVHGKTYAMPCVTAAVRCARQCALLEFQDKMDELVRGECRCRATLLGYEHEALYRLTWQEQCSRAQLAVHQGWLQSRRLPAERARQSLLARFFHACGQAICDEDAARTNLLAEEHAAWADCVALAQLDRLAQEQRALVTAALAEEELYSRTSTTRTWELGLAARAYRAPQAPALLSTHARRFFDVRDSEGGNGGCDDDENDYLSLNKRQGKAGQLANVTRSTKYLMNYTVSVDEYEARQRLCIEQERERVVLCAILAKTRVADEDEAAARAALMDLFHIAACPCRLHALIVLQRWWRLLHQHQRRCRGALSWRAYSRTALHKAISAYRWQLPAEAWKERVTRMERRWPRQEYRALPTIRSDPAAELQRCLDAAVSPRRYEIVLDDYIYTLTKRVANFVASLRYDYVVATKRAICAEEALPPMLQPARCIVPYRVFLRHGVSYDVWRQTRWAEGAAAWCAAVRALESGEVDARDALAARARHNEIGLQAMHAVLRAGVASNVWAYIDRLTLLAHTEDTARAALLHDEDEQRQLLHHTAAIVSARVCELMKPFCALHDAQVTARALLEYAETHARDELDGVHRYWARLAEVRLERLRRIGSTPLQRTLALRTGFCRHLNSPQTAAGLLRRVFARLRARREAERRAVSRAFVSPATLRERALRVVNGVLHAQLRRLQQERWSGAMAVPFVTEEAAFVARARRLHTSVALFAGWFACEADRPRELHYRDVLQRFHRRHATLFAGFNDLLCRMREARHRVEVAEEAARVAWCRESCYRQVASRTIAQRESRARNALCAAEADTRDELLEMYDFVRQLTRWSKAATAAVGFARRERPPCVRLSFTAAAYAPTTSDALVVPRRLRHVRSIVTRHATARSQSATTPASQLSPAQTTERDALAQMRYGVRSASPLRPYVPLEEHITNQQRLYSVAAAAAAMQQQLGGDCGDGDVWGAMRASTRGQRLLRLPVLTLQQRLVAREEVCRLRIVQHRRRNMLQICFDFSLYWRYRLIAAARDGLGAVAACADGRFPQHPPVAMFILLRAEERQARGVLEAAATMSLASPLERAHYMYLVTVLQPQFDFGHLTMSSNAFYMDRRLRELLLRRIAHLDTKIAELQSLEAAARSRVAYVEHITRELRFVYKKLIL